MDVSPHLKIRVPLVEVAGRAMREGRDEWEGRTGFVAQRSRRTNVAGEVDAGRFVNPLQPVP